MNFLNNLNLSKNELQNAAIQNLAIAPGSPSTGQIYWDTTLSQLRIYNGSVWASVQGDITAIATGSPDQLTVASSSGPVPTLSITTGSITDGSTDLVTSGTIFSYVAGIESGLVDSVTTGNANTITIGGTAANPTVAANTAAIAASGTNLATADQINTFVTDFGYSTTVGTVTNVTAGEGIRITGTSTVTPTIGVLYTGATNYIEVNGAQTADAEDFIPMADATNAVKKTALKDVPMAALTAVKTYVDTAVAGASSFQGGYNAATNVPNLEAPATGVALQGFQWAVTADGLFFTEQVRIGDLIIANVDNPTSLSQWTTIQGNVDLATTTVAGIASFSADNFAVSAVGAVTIKNNGVILGTETTGNYVATLATSTGLDNTTGTGEGSAPTVSLDFNELSADLGDMFITLTDGEPTPKKSTPAQAATILNAESTYAATITANATVTHNLGTRDVIVQLYDIVTFDTVFADVDRATTNTVGISFVSTPTNSIRVLVQKIG